MPELPSHPDTADPGTADPDTADPGTSDSDAAAGPAGHAADPVLPGWSRSRRLLLIAAALGLLALLAVLHLTGVVGEGGH
ncbi:hypothetical protein [Streptomyces sp. CA-111067]|uniref:hypothetical protein n=1 Tax=Streptomyces sp. CA-111067 TaxID=3240046 RepID=UPI003D95CB42